MMLRLSLKKGRGYRTELSARAGLVIAPLVFQHLLGKVAVAFKGRRKGIVPQVGGHIRARNKYIAASIAERGQQALHRRIKCLEVQGIYAGTAQFRLLLLAKNQVNNGILDGKETIRHGTGSLATERYEAVASTEDGTTVQGRVVEGVARYDHLLVLTIARTKSRTVIIGPFHAAAIFLLRASVFKHSSIGHTTILPSEEARLLVVTAYEIVGTAHTGEAIDDEHGRSR